SFMPTRCGGAEKGSRRRESRVGGRKGWSGSTARGAADALVRVGDVRRARHSARMLVAVRALHRAVRIQVEHQRPARTGPDAEPRLHRDAGARRKRYDVAGGAVRHSMASRSKPFELDRDAGNGRLIPADEVDGRQSNPELGINRTF